MATGTLLSFSKSPHWFVRGWDFPRVQIVVFAGVSGALYGLLFFRGRFFDWLFLAATALCVLWQVRKIYPYTSLAPVQVQRSEHPPQAATVDSKRSTARLLISNVLMGNRRHDLLLQLVRDTDPDIVFALETDLIWARALEPLAQTHPHVIRHPQDNCYGLMLFSRFPLIDPRVQFLVQDDIPSVHAAFQLPSGERVFFRGLHPRPPEPIRHQDSTPRDAELVLVGRAIGDAGNRPTIVAGDLNDVAWSPTSELFMRLSGLLDPRVGRGFFNSFNANSAIMRYPLDHVFHSNHFRLRELRRLPYIGSDHFPMLVELSYEPEARSEQPKTRQEAGDQRDAEEKVDMQTEAAERGADRPAQG